MTRWARSIHSMLRDSLAISENFSIAMCMCSLTIYICSLDTIIKTCVCAHTSHSPKHTCANFQQQLPSLRAVQVLEPTCTPHDQSSPHSSTLPCLSTKGPKFATHLSCVALVIYHANFSTHPTVWWLGFKQL